MNYLQFESYTAYILYQEFIAIPGNPIKFELPGNYMSVEIMYILLKMAYKVTGRDYYLS